MNKKIKFIHKQDHTTLYVFIIRQYKCFAKLSWIIWDTQHWSHRFGSKVFPCLHLPCTFPSWFQLLMWSRSCSRMIMEHRLFTIELGFPIPQPSCPNLILRLLLWVLSNQLFRLSIDFLLLATIHQVQQLRQLTFDRKLEVLGFGWLLIW